MSSRPAGYRLAIVNPLTLVGAELKTILHDRGLPHQRITLLTSLEEEAGALTEGVDEEAAFVQRISDDELEGEDLVFFCGPGEENRPWIEKSRALGFIAVDLSQPSAAPDGIPVVAGINIDAVSSPDSVVVSPHPIATPLIMLLSTLRSRATVELCAVTAIKPASEYGQRGIDELLQQTIKVLNVQSVPTRVFPRQLAFNLYPAVEGDRDEQYALRQIRSVAGDLPISLAIVQGTTFHSHTMSVFLKLKEDISERELAERFSRNGGIEVAAEGDTVSTVDASGRDEILVGRVRRDPALPGAYWVWLVSDNVRRGSALNAVIVAEDLLARFKPLRG